MRYHHILNSIFLLTIIFGCASAIHQSKTQGILIKEETPYYCDGGYKIISSYNFNEAIILKDTCKKKLNFTNQSVKKIFVPNNEHLLNIEDKLFEKGKTYRKNYLRQYTGVVFDELDDSLIFITILSRKNSKKTKDELLKGFYYNEIDVPDSQSNRFTGDTMVFNLEEDKFLNNYMEFLFFTHTSP